MEKQPIRVQIVTDDQELLRLRYAWDELFARADRPYVTQSFEWAWCVRKYLLQDGQLRCIFVWNQEHLVLIWPAIIIRQHHFWTAEVPIATFGDYIDFLVETSPEAEAFAKLAWQNRSLKADLILTGPTRVSSLLRQVITGAPVEPSGPARYLDWDQFTDWGTYYKSLSERRSIASRERRLLERGNISFTVGREINEVRNLSEWMIRHKEIWFAARGGGFTPWLGSKNYKNFLLSVAQELTKYGYLAAFALVSDDRTIAVQICVVGMTRIIRLHDAYDQEFRQFSPQHILTTRVMEWAYERRLNVDFCFGSEPYKEVFLPRNCPVEFYRVPNSRFGKLHELLRSRRDGTMGAVLRHVLRQVQKSIHD